MKGGVQNPISTEDGSKYLAPARGKELALTEGIWKARGRTRGGYLYTAVNPVGADDVFHLG